MNVLVVGASRGIGLEFCRQLKKNPENKVFATVRHVSAELKKLGVEQITGIDVADKDIWKKLGNTFAPKSLDCLIYNAGIFKLESLNDFNLESIEEQFYTNTLGAVAAIKALLPALREPSKIAFLTSLMGSMADNQSGSYYGYRMSKAALNAFAKSLSIDLRPKKITVTLLHPGYVKTDMTSHLGHIEPELSVNGLLGVIEKLSLKETGKFYRYDGAELPW